MSTLTHTLQHWWRARQSAQRMPVERLLSQRSLKSLFQPIVELRNGEVYGHEALIRPPRSTGETTVSSLFEAAREQRCEPSLELGCVDQAVEHWLAERSRGSLFVNISAHTLVHQYEQQTEDCVLEILRKHRFSPRRFGIDIGGYTRGVDIAKLVESLQRMRAVGVRIALDDFKASRQGLEVLNRVRPDFVKLAGRWTRHVDDDEDVSKVIRSLVRLTHGNGCMIVAKSVESESQLMAMQELGVAMAQGYFLGSPAAEPITSLNRRAQSVLADLN